MDAEGWVEGERYFHSHTILAKKLGQVFTWCTFDLLAVHFILCDWFCNYIGIYIHMLAVASCKFGKVLLLMLQMRQVKQASLLLMLIGLYSALLPGTLNLLHISVCNALVTFIIEWLEQWSSYAPSCLTVCLPVCLAGKYKSHSFWPETLPFECGARMTFDTIPRRWSTLPIAYLSGKQQQQQQQRQQQKATAKAAAGNYQ